MGAIGLGGVQIELRRAAENMEARIEGFADDLAVMIIVSHPGRLPVGKNDRERVVSGVVAIDKLHSLGDAFPLQQVHAQKTA